jgi:pyrroline-5-carboxylate reductase
MSTFFELQTTLVDWAVSKGLARCRDRHVTAQFAGLAAEGLAASDDELDDLAVEHETPGGLNEQVRRSLTDAGLFAEIARQLDHMHATRVAPPSQ